MVRRTLYPSESPPRSSGIVGVRGAINGAESWLGDLSAILYLGPGIEAAIVRASETGIYWYVALAHELVTDVRLEAEAIIRHIAPRFDATFRGVVFDTTDLRVDDLVDRDPIPCWGRGVVTLVGDAGHPVLPHTGQGAAQAIVDAVTLGGALTASGTVERALRSYEVARRKKMVALLARGRRTARLMRTTNPVAVALRDLVIRLLPVRPLLKTAAMVTRRSDRLSARLDS